MNLWEVLGLLHGTGREYQYHQPCYQGSLFIDCPGHLTEAGLTERSLYITFRKDGSSFSSLLFQFDWRLRATQTDMDMTLVKRSLSHANSAIVISCDHAIS